MSKSDLDVVDEALVILEDEKNWARQDWCIIDDTGHMTYCIEGAIMQAIDQPFTQLYENWLENRWHDDGLAASFNEEDVTESLWDYGASNEQYQRIIGFALGIFRRLYADREDLADALRLNAFNDDKRMSYEDMILGLKHTREELHNRKEHA